MESATMASSSPPPSVVLSSPSSLPPIPTPRSAAIRSSSRPPPPKAATSRKSAVPQHHTAERQASPSSVEPPRNDNNTAIATAATHGGTTADSQLASTDGGRKGSACPSDFSVRDGAVEPHGERDAAVDAFPSSLLVSSPQQQQQPQQRRGSWHGLEGGGLSLGNSTTQPNTSFPQPAHGPARRRLTSPTAPSTPPTSSSLFSLQDHSGTSNNNSLTSPPPPAAMSTPAGRSTTAAVTAATTAQLRAAKGQRRPYRLGSAQARRTVVAQQRHRKLFELGRGADASEAERESSGSGQMDMAAADTSAGWVAALSASVSTRFHSDRAESEATSTYSGPTYSRTSSTPYNTSSTGPAAMAITPPPSGRYASTNAIAAPPSPHPHRGTGGGSFKTTASLTSLQHRLWQHTITTSTTATTAVAASTTCRSAVGNPAVKASPLPLPLSPPLPPLPGLPRSTTGLHQGRHGLYATAVANSLSRTTTTDSHGTEAPRPVTYPPPSLATSTLVPVTQWEASLRDERMRGHHGKQVAQWLVQLLLTAPRTMDLDRSRYASVSTAYGGTDMNFDHHDETEEEGAEACGGGGGDLLRSLSERAAVAAYLLSTLVEDGLPRHQQSIVPYVRMLIEFAFVPDTPAVRTALGTGTVQDQELLDRLARYDHCPVPPSTTVHLLDLLVPAFTRKTYLTAHFELSGMVVGLAHAVRCRALHQRNVPRLLERTHRNWLRGLVRAVLRAWRRLCQERRVQEQRQRARWAQRWTSERMRIALRRWRGYAALTLQMAEADSVAQAALAQRQALIERLDNEAAAMQRSSQQLQTTLQRQDEEREVVEARIGEREILYQRLLRQVCEVDRVGSLMLNSLLLATAPPQFDDATTITALVSSPVSRRGSLSSATFGVTPRGSTAGSTTLDDDDDDDNVVDDNQRPPHAVTALPTLLQWAKDCCRRAEAAYLAVYPGEVEVGDMEDTTADDDGGAKHNNNSDDDGKPKMGTGVSSAPPSSRSRTPTSVQRRRSSAEGEAGPTHASLDFAALLLSATNEVGLADPSLGETVLLPLHKLLLLMRGCSGAEDGVEGCTADPAAAASLEDGRPRSDLLPAGLDSAGNQGEMDDDGAMASAVAPSFGMIRTVHGADAGVLKEAYALLDKDSGALPGTYPEPSPRTGGGAAAAAAAANEDAELPSPGLSLMLRLSPKQRDTLQRVCRVVIDAYERLTGTACVVTAEQLFERSRGTLLVLLAALMRHYTNWMVRRTQQALPAPSATIVAVPSDSISAAPSGNGVVAAAAPPSVKGTRKTNSEGAAHERYDEWFHPPRNHRRWRRQVRRQAEWIALSFSAVHEAMRIATLPSRVLTVGQQDHVSGLLQQLSLTEFIDLLPNSPDQTMQCYVSMVGIVERYAPSLHLLFHHFALPLTQLRADGGTGAATTAQPKQRRSIKRDSAQNTGSPEKEMYITANTVWQLLCLTGLAGDVHEEYCTTVSRQQSDGAADPTLVTPPLSATLHRPAVFSLVEQVTQHGVASTAVSLRRASTRPQGSPSGTRLSAAPVAAGAEASGVGSMTSPLVQTVSCKSRPRTCYARALREGRHVDLRADMGAVCVNYTQFVKVLVRLAHAWQCQQQQREEAERNTTRMQQQEGEGEAQEEEGEVSATSAEATPTLPRSRATSVAVTGGGAASISRSRRTSAVAAASAKTRRPSSPSTRMAYEDGHYAPTLCLPYFHAFFGELLLPRLLGANRWVGAAQRAMCSRPVLQLFAQHHDALVSVFNDYQRPREARGVRASLPPPYSTVLASQLFSHVVDAERQASSGLTVGGGRSMSHVQRASLMYGLNSSMNRRGSNTLFFDEDAIDSSNNNGSRGARSRRASAATARATAENNALNDNLRASIAAVQRSDVGIVSVLQWTDVLLLAKDMQWFKIHRLTEPSLRNCYEHVRADLTREGDAIFFAEFLQLLCSVAYYASASPVLPLEVKLKGFLEAYVFPSQD